MAKRVRSRLLQGLKTWHATARPMAAAVIELPIFLMVPSMHGFDDAIYGHGWVKRTRWMLEEMVGEEGVIKVDIEDEGQLAGVVKTT